MTGFITRRLASAVLLLFATSVVVFGIFEVIPSYNPARAIAGREATAATVAEISQKFGFDKPIYVQYGNTMKLIFTGQIIDYQDNLNVVSQFVHRFPVRSRWCSRRRSCGCSSRSCLARSARCGRAGCWTAD